MKYLRSFIGLLFLALILLVKFYRDPYLIIGTILGILVITFFMNLFIAATTKDIVYFKDPNFDTNNILLEILLTSLAYFGDLCVCAIMLEFVLMLFFMLL